MRLPDWLAARLRTVWPYVFAFLGTWLFGLAEPIVGWLHDTLGVDLTEAQVGMGVGVVLGWGVYEAGRWLEIRPGTSWPARIARGAGRLILSMGLPTGQPTYTAAS